MDKALSLAKRNLNFSDIDSVLEYARICSRINNIDLSPILKCLKEEEFINISLILKCLERPKKEEEFKEILEGIRDICLGFDYARDTDEKNFQDSCQAVFDQFFKYAKTYFEPIVPYQVCRIYRYYKKTDSWNSQLFLFYVEWELYSENDEKKEETPQFVTRAKDRIFFTDNNGYIWQNVKKDQKINFSYTRQLLTEESYNNEPSYRFYGSKTIETFRGEKCQ